ncbi:MAG: ribonuclease R [Pseudomonadota bacterium]
MTELTKAAVAAFLADNPDITTRRDIAKGLGLKGDQRRALRAILRDMEADGALVKTAKRAVRPVDQPPGTTIVAFGRIDGDGSLIGRAVGREGLYGPEIIYAGQAGMGAGQKGRKGRRGEAAASTNTPGVGDRALCRLSERGGEWTAKVIKKLDKRMERPVIGLFTATGHGGRIESANRKGRDTFLVDRDDVNGAETGDLVRAKQRASTQQRRGYGPKRAMVTEVIGKVGDPRAASLIAIHAHGLPEAFPDAVMAEAQAGKRTKAAREDLTGTPLITIDPEDARDHDDAVFAEALTDGPNKGGCRVIVAIADVAAFVTEGSALDQEAYKRGNSTYFPDRVVPMLPFELSADACSLREDEDRACFAVEMIFGPDGGKRDHRFFRAMMRSHAKLSYEEAQAAVDGKPSKRAKAVLETVLKPLWGAYGAIAAARDKRGPLDLDLPEQKIVFAKDGSIERIATKDRLDAHRLIEAFMIEANVCAAESLERARTGLVYRVHDAPSQEKIAAFSDFLATLKMKWPKGERPQTGRFNALLDDIKGSDHAQMITEMVLRTQSQAVYSPDNLGHFGLNLQRYAHFTSPIRRYADLVVHRALVRALDLGPDGISDKALAQLEETASHITDTERRSMAAEREATDRYMALFLADRVGAEFEGRITGVAKAGLFVRLADTAADGFVPIATLGDEYWVFDEAAMGLVARGSGRRYDLGQRVSVRLREVTPLQGGLLLEMMSEARPKRKGEKPPSGDRDRGRGRSNSRGGPNARRRNKR